MSTPETTTADGLSAHELADLVHELRPPGDHHDRALSVVLDRELLSQRERRGHLVHDERAVLAWPRVVRELDDLARRRPAKD